MIYLDTKFSAMCWLVDIHCGKSVVHEQLNGYPPYVIGGGL